MGYFPQRPMTPDTILAPRLQELLASFAGFTSSSPGVTRLVYGEAWCRAHVWLAEQARSLGLTASPDAFGNLYFHPASIAPGQLERSVLLIGSHLSTAVGDGPLNGAYGVLSALLVTAALQSRRALPVVGFASCASEDNRFGLCQPGAHGMLGISRMEEVETTRDGDGVSWARALAGARERGCAAPLVAGEHPCVPLFHPAVMLELHVEQGPVLESEGLDLGIVEQAAGCRRMRAVIVGEARYAGTTPMALRRDALAAAAEMVGAAEKRARKAGPPAVITAGALKVEPGLYDTVPGRCELVVEVRHSARPKLVELTAALGQQFRAIAEERGLEIQLDELGGLEPVTLSAGLAEAAAKLAARAKIPFGSMASGSSHDAMVFARHGVPALLLYVPSRHGVSRGPDESADPRHLEIGQKFLLDFAGWLTDARD
jgi:allantoate deiminase